jgi:hypothetical protein
MFPLFQLPAMLGAKNFLPVGEVTCVPLGFGVLFAAFVVGGFCV